MLVSDSREVPVYLIDILGRLPFLLQDCLPFRLRFQLRPNKPGASISSHLLRCKAFAVVHYSCMPCALHMRQTQRLLNSGNMPFAKLKKRWALEREQRKTRSKTIKRLLLEQGKTVFEKFSVSKVIIFGSVADNLCGEKSDLDILVTPLSNDKYWEFRHVLEEAIGVQIDLYTENDDPVLVKKILSRGEILYEVQS